MSLDEKRAAIEAECAEALGQLDAVLERRNAARQAEREAARDAVKAADRLISARANLAKLEEMARPRFVDAPVTEAERRFVEAAQRERKSNSARIREAAALLPGSQIEQVGFLRQVLLRSRPEGTNAEA